MHTTTSCEIAKPIGLPKTELDVFSNLQAYLQQCCAVILETAISEYSYSQVGLSFDTYHVGQVVARWIRIKIPLGESLTNAS